MASGSSSDYLEVELNAVLASSLLITGVVVDSMTFIDPDIVLVNGAVADPRANPTALRSTSCVLLAVLAAPPIFRNFVFTQRVVLMLLLGAAALAGEQVGSSTTRFFDGLYCLLSIFVIIFVFLFKRPKKISSAADLLVFRDTLTSLAASLLLFISLRGIRQALIFCHRTTQYVIDGSRGYASFDGKTFAALAFGNGVCMASSTFLFFSTELRRRGTSAAVSFLLISAFFQFAAAFFGMVFASQQFIHLNAIFGQSACAVRSACEAAFHARRRSMASSCSAQLWIASLATAALAYAPDARVSSRAAMLVRRRDLRIVSFFSFVSLTALLVCFYELPFDSLEDISIVLGLCGLWAAVAIDSLVGVYIYTFGIVIELFFVSFVNGGAISSLAHFTNACTFTFIVLFGAVAVLLLFGDVLWSWLPSPLLDVVDRLIGSVIVAGMSIALFLFVGSVSLMSSYNGDRILDVREGQYGPTRSALSFVLLHFMPLMVFGALAVSRCETCGVTGMARRIIYFLSPIVPAAITGVSSLAINGAGDGSEMWFGNFHFILVFVSCAPAWVVGAYV